LDKRYLSTASRVLLVSLFVGFISSSLTIAQPQQPDKQKIVNRVAQDWMRVGAKQYERGFYSQAEKSLLRALDYKKYLSVSDLNQINELLTKVKNAAEDNSKVDENMKKGGLLFAEGKLPEAQMCYEQAKSSQNISADKLKYIEETLKEIDRKIKQRKKVAGQIYKDSVKFFEKEDYENARKGFLEVSREELFQAEKGKSAEQYLAKIDAIFVQRTEFPSLEEEKIEREKAKTEESLLTEIAAPTGSDGKTEESVEVIGVIEVVDVNVNEPTVDVAKVKIVETESKPKLSVKESYSRAVVKNAVDTADKLAREGRFYHAQKAVEKAFNVLTANRNMIGDELYNQYKEQLKILSEMIIAGRMEWLGETEDKTEQKN